MTHRFGASLVDQLVSARNMTDHARVAKVAERAYDGGALALDTSITLTFEPAARVRFLVLANGEVPPTESNRSLTVETQDPDGTWLHRGTTALTFGDLTDGLPFVLDLGPGTQLAAIRLSADGPAVLAELATIGPRNLSPDFRFVATRFDGLCQRLTTLLDAAVLAEVTGQDFGFTWMDADLPEIDAQANDDLTALFTPSFIDRHRVPVDALAPGMPRYFNQRYSKAQFDQMLAAAADHGDFWVDRPGNLPVIFPHLADKMPSGTNARVFDQLGFTPGARAALDLAREIDLPPKPVALHLRAGDIVHGTHSNHGGYIHKAVSIFEAEGAAEKTRDNGNSLVLIGQEASFCNALANRFDHVTSFARMAEVHGLTRLQSVLFDMGVMARMRWTWAAQSAVSQLAQKLGEGKIAQLKDGRLLPGPEVFDTDPFAGPDYAGISDNFKAYSALKVAWTQPISAWSDATLTAVRYAMSKRPGVQFPHLFAAAIQARIGRLDRAEEEAKTALALQPLAPDWDAVSDYLLSDDPAAPEEVLTTLAGGGGKGRPALSLLSAAIRAKHLGDEAATASVERMFRGEADANLRPELVAGVRRAIFGAGKGAARPEDAIDWLI